LLKKKSVTSLGLITDFCVCDEAISPLSTPVPAAENNLSYEEKNKAVKDVDGEQVHYDAFIFSYFAKT
jgi:hypothetical protein